MKLLFALLSTALAPTSASAVQGDVPEHPLEETVVELTLANGWLFLLVPRPGAPVVSIETAIDVGSVDDGRGQRGLANLFAALTLHGSERVGSTDWAEERVALATVEEAHRRWLATLESADSDETAKAYGAFLDARDRAREYASPESFLRFLEDAGGAATTLVETAPDWTRYAVTLPSNQLELWCWLEAERFARPCLRGFFAERDRWIEARRRDLESDPQTTLLEQLRLAALTTHPYRHPVEGYVDDLSKLGKAAAEDFFREHYGPGRLVTTVVGDFRPDALIPLLERYVATVPGNLGSTERDKSEVAESDPRLERRISVSYPAPPRMAFAWAAPAFSHTDSAAMEVTARVLGPGPGSRLHRRLVLEDALVTDLDVRSAWPGELSENLVLVTLTPLAGVDPARIEEAVAEELADLRERGPDPDELEALKRAMRTEREGELADAAQLARLLNRYQLLADDWRLAYRRPDQWDEVTLGSVQAVVDVYFTDVRRTLALISPDEHAPKSGFENEPLRDSDEADADDAAEPAEPDGDGTQPDAPGEGPATGGTGGDL